MNIVFKPGHQDRVTMQWWSMFICALLAFGWSSAQVADIDRTVEAIEQSLDLNLQFSNVGLNSDYTA